MPIIARLASAIALSAVLVALAAGPGCRLGLWGWKMGLAILSVGTACCGASFLLCVLGAWWSRRRGSTAGIALCVAGLLVTGAIAIVPYGWSRRARMVPAIHDISTDLDDPPPFVAILANRKDAPNPATYGGGDVARKQLAAYPDIAPALLQAAPDEVFDRSLATARSLGWEIVAADRKAGRIEATDTTFWFGFKDDVVIRIRKGEGAQATRVDVRSVSRVGKSDVGTNAARIRRFLDLLSPPPRPH